MIFNRKIYCFFSFIFIRFSRLVVLHDDHHGDHSGAITIRKLTHQSLSRLTLIWLPIYIKSMENNPHGKIGEFFCGFSLPFVCRSSMAACIIYIVAIFASNTLFLILLSLNFWKKELVLIHMSNCYIFLSCTFYQPRCSVCDFWITVEFPGLLMNQWRLSHHAVLLDCRVK